MDDRARQQIGDPKDLPHQYVSNTWTMTIEKSLRNQRRIPNLWQVQNKDSAHQFLDLPQ